MEALSELLLGVPPELLAVALRKLLGDLLRNS